MNEGRKTILFERLHESVELPARATASSAGYDLKAYLLGNPIVKLSLGGRQYEGTPRTDPDGDGVVLELLPGERATVPLGFRATRFRLATRLRYGPGVAPASRRRW